MKVYISYVCGYACIREMGTDKVLHELKGKRSIEQHLEAGFAYAKKNGWEITR